MLFQQAGAVVWEGLSVIDNKPIVLLLTLRTDNRKTGSQIQSWIMRSDMPPTEAAKSGEDKSICGDCHRRPINDNTCYVTIFMGPLSIYKSYKKGNYLRASTGDLKLLLKGCSLRMGAYGDPAAVPFEVWEPLIKAARTHTGFTHQWKEPFAEQFKGVCQASCSTVDEHNEASERGWKTYVSLPVGHPKVKGLKLCHNSVNEHISCALCSLCDGSKKDVYVEDHGTKHKIRYYSQNKVQS